MHEFYILPEKYFSIFFFFGGGEAAPVSYAYARKVAKKSIQSAKLLLSLTYVSFSRSFFLVPWLPVQVSPLDPRGYSPRHIF